MKWENAVNGIVSSTNKTRKYSENKIACEVTVMSSICQNIIKDDT